MSNLLLRKILTSVLYVALALVVECYMFATFGWGIFPTYPLFDLGLILFFGFLIFLCKSRKGSNIFLCIVLGVQIILSYLNIVMMSMLGTVFSITMIFLVGETAQVVTLEMFPFAPIIFFGLIIAILTLSLLFLRRIPVDKKSVSKLHKYTVRFAVLLGMTLSMGLYTLQVPTLKKLDEERYLLGDNYLFNTFSDGKLSIQKFGSYCFYIEQLARTLVKPELLNDTTADDLEKYLESETYDPKDSPLWNSLAKNGDNNIFIMMLESFEWYAISPEITPVLYGLANGYDFGKAGEMDSNGVVQTKDGWRLYEMYDFFETDIVDKNGDSQKYLDLLRKDYTYDANTNTFTKIDGVSVYDSEYESTYGLTLINYYSKAKTDYSEASVVLGNYPYNKSYVERAGFTETGLYSNVDYCFTLPNVLTDSGYVEEGEAQYFHTYHASFYGRTNILKQFGFDDLTFYEDFTQNPVIETGNSLSHAILDSQVMSEFGYQFIHRDENYQKITDKPWLSFFTTVSTHGEFTTYNPLLEKHYAFIDCNDWAGKPDKAVSNESVLGQARTYLAGCLDTEYMVAHLLNYLIQTGEFSNTTLVLYSDHNAYYNNLEMTYKTYYYSESSDYENFRSDYYLNGNTGKYGFFSSEQYSVPAFIYATDLDESVTGTAIDEETGDPYKVQYIEKFTCAFDILPTIFTMCGIEFDPHYYLGYPVICPQTIDGEVVEQGTKVIISHTGGYFNNRIFSEDGLVANYQVEGVTSQELKQFSVDCVDQLEKWYYITAMFDNNAFKKVPLRQ